MTAPSPARKRRFFSPSQETFEMIFSFVYTFLMADAALLAANAPLAFMLFAVPDPLSFWPLFLVLSLTVAPSVAGVFGCFRAMHEGEPPRPFAAFWRGYRRNAGRAFVVGVATALVMAISLFDVTVMAGTGFGLLFGPLFVVLGASAIAVCATALCGFALYEQASAWAIVKASIYLAIKRWYFSAMALVLIGLIIAAVLVQPVLGAALVPGILLFAVWSNAQFSFTRLVALAH